MTLDDNLPAIPRWPLVMLTAGLTALTILMAASVLVGEIGERVKKAGFSDDPREIHLTIADTAFAIPANMIRFDSHRVGGRHERVDLAFAWPGLRGFTTVTEPLFQLSGRDSPLVFASIIAESEAPDAAERMNSLYERFIEGDGFRGPVGLVGHRLSGISGYGDETVFYEPDAAMPFVARCTAPTDPEIPETCMSDLRISGNLLLQYRFRRGLLDDWRQLRTGIDMFVAAVRR